MRPVVGLASLFSPTRVYFVTVCGGPKTVLENVETHSSNTLTLTIFAADIHCT